MTNPDIMADCDRCRATPLEKFRFIVGVIEIGARPIGEMRLRRPVHRMIAGIDADHGGNRTKFSDCRINDISIVHDVGIIIHHRLDERCACANFRVAAKC